MNKITAKDGDAIIAHLDYRDGSGKTIEIYDIAVSKYHRERGIGRKMIEELKEKVNTHFIFAITRESNHRARKFYAALGFRKVAILGRMYGEENAVMYGLDL